MFEMAQGRWMRFADGLEHEFFCLGGALSVTGKDARRPVMLSPGDSYRCDGTGMVMLRALSDAQVRLVSPLPELQPSPLGRVPAVFGDWLMRLRR